MSRLRLSAILLVLMLAFPVVALGPLSQSPTQAAPAPTPLPSAPPGTLEEMIARVKPAVVYLSARGALGGSWSCSGFIYDPSGFVLTNHHCVDAAAEITVTLPDRRTFAGTVLDYIRVHENACPPVRVDTWIDGAVLKINGTSLPTIPVGESGTLRQGQELFVLGYPQPSRVSPEEVSVSRGIVSAVRPGWIQTDAVIIGGNSGGPVVDRQGRVVGLAAFLAAYDVRGGSGFGGIVHIDAIRQMARTAVTGGPRVQEFRVTGQEYIPPVLAGARRVFRNTYAPGNTQGRASVTEVALEVTQVQNFFGTFVYTIRDPQGMEVKNLLDTGGLYRIGVSGGPWRYSYPRGEPLLFPLWPPPCLNYQWQYVYQAQNTSDGTIRQATVTSAILSNNDAVSVPAGSFPQTLRIVSTHEIVDTRAGQSQRWRLVSTSWWAAGVGVVRVVTEDPATREQLMEDLVSSGTPASASPPAPPPTPPSPPSPPPAPPQPSPPPQPTPPPQPAPPPPEVPQPGPNDRAIEPGGRMGAARLGASLDDVIRVVGEVPTVSTSQNPGGTTGVIVYEWKNRLFVYVDRQTRIIQRVGVWAPNPQSITDPPFQVRGVGLGSERFDVTRVFGQPDTTQDDKTNPAVVYVYDRLGVAFHIGTSPQYWFNGQVYKMYVFKPGTYR